jgi:hypothetical protein
MKCQEYFEGWRTALVFCLLGLGFVTRCGGGQPEPPGQAGAGAPVHAAYLFAHMTHQDYGRLYYSVSRDGLHWTALAEGKRILEAPMLIPSPDDTIWYLYYEQYPGVSYGLSVADDLDGPWYQLSGNTSFRDWDKFRLPARVRHGCMITLSRAEYDALVAHFGTDDTKP